MEHEIKHPILGTIKGLAQDGIAQFRGIKYATLKGRFATAVVKEYDYSSPIDATKFGPTVITFPGGCEMEFGIIQHALSNAEYPGMSDVDGLHLNITLPSGAKVGDNLPVVVFIHGGALRTGGNYMPQTDFTRLVKVSIDAGQPIIGIAINYRLGVPGFLDSQFLREQGIPPNRGLRDQRTAFKWIAQNIPGFGGDSNNITAMGESAGAVSVMLAMHASEPLFQRAACLSGHSMVFPVLPQPATDAAYQSVLEVLGFKDLPSQEQLAALESVDPSDLFTKIGPQIPLLPAIEEELLPQSHTFATIESGPSLQSALPGAAWCKSLMIGSLDLDAHVFTLIGVFPPGVPVARAFRTSLNKNAGCDQAQLDALFAHYKIEDDTPDDEAKIKVLKFATDIVFFAPSIKYAQCWPGEAYLYLMKEPNPWDGPFKGYSTHVLDVAYIFQNYTEFMDEYGKKVALDMAHDLIKFASGQQPFAPYDSDKTGRIYGLEGRDKESSLVSEISPPAALQEVWDNVGLDNLSRAWGMYAMGL